MRRASIWIGALVVAATSINLQRGYYHSPPPKQQTDQKGKHGIQQEQQTDDKDMQEDSEVDDGIMQDQDMEDKENDDRQSETETESDDEEDERALYADGEWGICEQCNGPDPKEIIAAHCCGISLCRGCLTTDYLCEQHGVEADIVANDNGD